jgi:hypothetical protein
MAMVAASGRADRLLSLCLLAAALCAGGCQKEQPPPPPPTPGAHLIALLPADGEVGDWKRIDACRYYDSKLLAELVAEQPQVGAVSRDAFIAAHAVGMVRCACGQDADRSRVVVIDLYEMPDKAAADAVIDAFYDSNAELGTMGETLLWTASVVRPAVVSRPAEEGRPAVEGRPAILRAEATASMGHFIITARSSEAAEGWVSDLKRLVRAICRRIHESSPPPGRPGPPPPEPIPSPPEPTPPTRPAPPPPSRPTTFPTEDQFGPIAG